LFPTQLLESLLAAVVLAISLSLGRSRAPGLVFATWLLGFGASRTVAGFLRSYEADDWMRLAGRAVPLFQLLGVTCAVMGLAAIALIRSRAAAQSDAPEVEGAVARAS
jgi:prolipoprotein diacylglyceryltransferase